MSGNLSRAMNMNLRAAYLLSILCLGLSQTAQSQSIEVEGSTTFDITVTVIAPTPTCILSAGTATSLSFPGRVEGVGPYGNISVGKADGGQVTFTKSSGCAGCSIAAGTPPSTLSSGGNTVRVWTSQDGTGSMTSASQTYHLWGIVEFLSSTSAGAYTGSVSVSASCS